LLSNHQLISSYLVTVTPQCFSCNNTIAFLDQHPCHHIPLITPLLHALAACPRTTPMSPPQGPGAAAGGALAGKSLKAFQFVSVCSHFKKQLAELMSLLNELEPHYVRCIKPNPASKPLLLDDMYALHQLKCGGVMEAVRISCAGESGAEREG